MILAKASKITQIRVIRALVKRGWTSKEINGIMKARFSVIDSQGNAELNKRGEYCIGIMASELM